MSYIGSDITSIFVSSMDGSLAGYLSPISGEDVMLNIGGYVISDDKVAASGQSVLNKNRTPGSLKFTCAYDVSKPRSEYNLLKGLTNLKDPNFTLKCVFANGGSIQCKAYVKGDLERNEQKATFDVTLGLHMNSINQGYQA